MALDHLVEAFYQSFYRSAHNLPLEIEFSKKLPREHLVSKTPDKNGWVEWQLLDRSKEIDPHFETLEDELCVLLPESFKRWHSRYYTLDGDIGILRLPAVPSGNPFGPLRELMLEHPEADRFLDLDLVPFGWETMHEAGPLVFDTAAESDTHDWPIKYYDPDWKGTDREVSPVIFSNFAKLMECCIAYWAGSQPLTWEARSRRIEKFFEIDPKGAGRPGRAYWRKWIEDEPTDDGGDPLAALLNL